MQKPDDNLHQFISVSILFGIFFLLNNVVFKSVLFSEVFLLVEEVAKYRMFLHEEPSCMLPSSGQ